MIRGISVRIKLIIVFGTILYSTLCFALPSLCEKKLKDTVRFEVMRHCQRLIQQCPTENGGPFHQQSCIDSIVKKNSPCHQLQEIADKVEAFSAETIFPLNENLNFSLIKVLSPADGNEQYYLVTPARCIIDTVIDPRTLEPQLKKHYSNQDFFIMNASPPRIKIENSNKLLLNIPLIINEQCRACKPIAETTIQLEFNIQGELISRKVLQFKKL